MVDRRLASRPVRRESGSAARNGCEFLIVRKRHLPSITNRYDVFVRWHEYLENPEAIRSLYGDVPPLTAVRLMKVQLQEGGPTAVLSLVLPTYPIHPPIRWSRTGFNAATLNLRLFAVRRYEQSGWQVNNIVDIHITKEGDSLHLKANGPSLHMFIECGFLDVAGVSGYVQENSAG